MNKAAFLDRDGVINRKAKEGAYITTWQEMEILPGVAEAIALLKQADFQVIVISNQRCVAKGLISIPELETLHQRMRDTLAAAGGVIDSIYYCPHESQPKCDCRKPAPGMILAAAREHQINLHESWMIGDSSSDIAAGKSAGCKTARVLSNGKKSDGTADLAAASLLDASRQILQKQ